ncbi:hypothetical protein ABZW18_04155 [Streptomyces sp. NPDC004647]|uniref:hypothetical protein n=1 Tax=Streptomyces sp. NPDC004647 TaxID=3154671 RepID=UPI0033B3DBF5
MTVMDESGKRVERWEFAHAEEDFATTLASLGKHGAPADLPVMIEASRDQAVENNDDARTGDKRHPPAIRILARAWLRVMWARRRDGTCHDPATHQTNRKINTTADTPLAA